MKLRIHLVSQFPDGELAMGTVEGLPTPQKMWIINAGRAKFIIRSEDNNGQPNEKHECFDSPESALAEIERRSTSG